MEQRSHPRFIVESLDISGRIMLANKVEILNISVGGVLVKTDKRLNVGTIYMLRLESKGKLLTLPCKVVRAELSESHKDSIGQSIPIYSAGMQFTNVSNEQINTINDFLKGHVIGYQKQELKAMDKISDLRLYVRFLIKTPEQATIQCYDSYKLKDISMGGIRIESDYRLEVGEKQLMEIVLPGEKTVKFSGKVISCFLLGNKEPKQYDIGIKFLDMSDQDKETFKFFLKSL
jgi:Tfp pilus assembly protein PilZ